MSSKPANDFKTKLDDTTKSIQSRAKKQMTDVKKQLNKTVKQVPKEMSKLDKLAQAMVDYKYVPLAIFTFLYIASPVDVIPEMWVGGIGYLEDVIVMIASIAFVVYTKKKGGKLYDNKSRYSKDKTDEELYAFIVRNDSKPDSNPDVRQQDNAPVDDINLVGNLVGNLPMDDMSIPSGESEVQQSAVEQPETEQLAEERDTKPVSTNTSSTNNNSEPKSCFDHSSINVCGVYETRERFSTPSQPDTQRVESNTLIW